jgi:hypothetical protein
MYPYGGSVPPWVDQHATVNEVPTAIVDATLWSAAVKNPYNDNLPPWIDYNIQTPAPVLTISGNVNNPMALTVSQMMAINVYNANIIENVHGKNVHVNATQAMSLKALIQAAQPRASATQVIFTGSDGFTPTPYLPLTAITADSAIAFTTDKGLMICIPEQKSFYWVYDLNSITVV